MCQAQYLDQWVVEKEKVGVVSGVEIYYQQSTFDLVSNEIPFEEPFHRGAIKHPKVSPQNVLLAAAAPHRWIDQESRISDHLR